MESDELLDALKDLDGLLAGRMRAEYERDLPFADLIVDRWARAARLGWGQGASVYQECIVIGDVQVGANSWIGPFTVLDGSGHLKIGGNCSISAGVQIYTHDSVQRRLTDGRFGVERAPTTIGDSCYVGPHAVVAKGVTIGHHSVVGANSVVLESAGPYSLLLGTPARRRGEVRFSEGGTASWSLAPDPLLERLAAIEAAIKDITERLREVGNGGRANQVE